MQYRKHYILILVLNLFVFYSANPAFLPIFIIEPSLAFAMIDEPISFFSLGFIFLLSGQLILIFKIFTKKVTEHFLSIGIVCLCLGIVFTYLGISEVDDEPAVPMITSIPFLIATGYYFIKRSSYQE